MYEEKSFPILHPASQQRRWEEVMQKLSSRNLIKTVEWDYAWGKKIYAIIYSMLPFF